MAKPRTFELSFLFDMQYYKYQFHFAEQINLKNICRKNLKKLNFKNISEIFDLNGDKRSIKAQLF